MPIADSREGAFVLLLLAGCPGGSTDTGGPGGTSGGTTTGTTHDEPTGDATHSNTDATSDATTGDPPSEDLNAFFVPARQGDQAFVLRVSPAAGTAEPFGPALPVAADELRYPVVLATPDGSLVTVRCYFEPEVPLATLLVGDGAGWQVVTKYNEFGLGGSRMADDAALMWFDKIATPDTPTFQATVIDMTGNVVFMGEPRSGDESLDPEAFGPAGAWFSYTDPERGLVLRTAAGAEAEMPAEHTHVGFAGSVVVTDFTNLQWVDLAGQPLAVPGFVPLAGQVSSLGYQVADGVLSRLTDGAVESLQKVPAELTVDDVYRHAEGFAVARLDGVWRTISGEGAVQGGFVPQPTTHVPDSGELESRHYVVAACLDCETRTVVFVASNDVVEGDTSFSFDLSVQLWHLGPLGGTTGQSMLIPWTEVTAFAWGPRDFHFSADGAFLVWTTSSGLFRLNVASAEVTTFGEGFELVQ